MSLKEQPVHQLFNNRELKFEGFTENKFFR